MGRYKKYVTQEDRREAKSRWNHEYYIRNKKRIDREAKKRYHRKMEAKMPDMQKSSSLPIQARLEKGV